MITRFRIENFKGHRDTNLVLEQFTVLVGDNGSGKTSVLEALRLPGQLGMHGDDLALDELLLRGEDHLQLLADGRTRGEDWRISIAIKPPEVKGWPTGWKLIAEGYDASENFGGHEWISCSGLPDEDDQDDQDESPMFTAWLPRIRSLMGRVALYRFRSDQVAASAYSDQPGTAIAEDGAQTAVALAALKLSDDEAFGHIEHALRRLVPSFRRVIIKPAKLKHPSNPNPVVGSKLYFDFQGAKEVPAHHASQGTLVALALLTVLHGHDRPRVILLDDFDHSLHPRAQMELVRMIRELLALDEFQDTQIIATTHSPYVLDEVPPSNVIAFALRDDGTVASKPLSRHPDAPKMTGALKSGELWTLDGERDWVL